MHAGFATTICRRNHSLLPQRKFVSDADHIVATTVAGGPFFFATTKIRIGCVRSLRRRPQQAGRSSLRQRKLESDAEGRCGDGHSRRAIFHRHDDYVASIPKFGPEIKNRCTKEGVNGEKLTSIRKSGPEIENRCTQEGINRQNPASIPKSRPEIKNRFTLALRLRSAGETILCCRKEN